MGLPHWYQKPISWFDDDQHFAAPLFGALMLWHKSGCSLAARKTGHAMVTQTSSTDQLRAINTMGRTTVLLYATARNLRRASHYDEIADWFGQFAASACAIRRA
jgi:hypothetical protein